MRLRIAAFSMLPWTTFRNRSRRSLSPKKCGKFLEHGETKAPILGKAFPTSLLNSCRPLTPAKDITGGKIIGRGKRKVKNRVAVALRTASTTLLKSDSYLGARYRSLRRKLPSFASAVKAMGRYLAVLIHRLLTKGEAWGDRGATQFERRHTEQELASLSFKARAKGFKLIPITEAS